MVNEIESALQESGLEARRVGRSQYFFRKTPANMQKLKCFARKLGAAIYQPLWPPGPSFRIERDADCLAVDFCWKAGVRLPGIKPRHRVEQPKFVSMEARDKELDRLRSLSMNERTEYFR
jgi:hypothetical protein